MDTEQRLSTGGVVPDHVLISRPAIRHSQASAPRQLTAYEVGRGHLKMTIKTHGAKENVLR
jgi:hypothetical protein